MSCTYQHWEGRQFGEFVFQFPVVHDSINSDPVEWSERNLSIWPNEMRTLYVLLFLLLRGRGQSMGYVGSHDWLTWSSVTSSYALQKHSNSYTIWWAYQLCLREIHFHLILVRVSKTINIFLIINMKHPSTWSTIFRTQHPAINTRDHPKSLAIKQYSCSTIGFLNAASFFLTQYAHLQTGSLLDKSM